MNSGSSAKISNFVFVVTLIVCIAVAIAVTAQSTAVDPAQPQLRPGISVTLPVTRNSVVVPDADKLDAVVLAITHEGSVYVGLDRTELSALPAKINQALANHAQKVLYIKADARTPYDNLIKVMDSLHSAGVEEITLLTNQPETSTRTLIPPKGIELLLAPRP